MMLWPKSRALIFQSTLPRGSDPTLRICVKLSSLFQSTLPRGSDSGNILKRINCTISIHAPSRERQLLSGVRRTLQYFNPRSLAGATMRYSGYESHWAISIHAPSRERHVQEFFDLYTDAISIHAPSRERHKTPLCSSLRLLFQSTLPRGSDTELLTPTPAVDISIHAPSRERPACRAAELERAPISIHAPSRERLKGKKFLLGQVRFQSTLPRGSDRICYKDYLLAAISIHAPSRERPAMYGINGAEAVISIHAPSRERRTIGRSIAFDYEFQSTLPRGSDNKFLAIYIVTNISIHAPSRERLQRIVHRREQQYFNPRSLAGATKYRYR